MGCKEHPALEVGKCPVGHMGASLGRLCFLSSQTRPGRAVGPAALRSLVLGPRRAPPPTAPPPITWERTALGTWPEATVGTPAAGGVSEEELGFISISLGSN